MTSRKRKAPAPQPDDKIDEEVWESFPASDPPAFMNPGPVESPPEKDEEE